jgi:hypothetical protein
MTREKPPISSHSVVLADTSLFCRVEETLPWTALVQLLDHFDSRLRIVTDVHRELTRHERGRFTGLKMMRKAQMIGEFLRGPAEHLPPKLAVQVGQIASALPSAQDSTHPEKNYGEVATALLAREIGSVAVIDDGDGQKVAHRRGVVTYTTREVAVELAVAGVLSDDDAATLWAAVFDTKRERHYFDAAVALARGRLGQDADAVPS